MTLTLAIPSYQRRDHLAELLDSIEQSVTAERANEINVVVVLDGSIDGSRELIEERRRTFPVDLRAVWQENAGPAATRNRCAAEAEGELIWFIDDDMRINADALVAHTKWDRQTTPIVMGPCSIRLDDPSASVARSWYEERWERLGKTGRATDPMDIAFANTSMPRELARQHQFNEEFRGYGAEDYELALRLLDAGVEIGYTPNADVEHVFTPSSDERLRKRCEEGRNRVLLSKLHPGSATSLFAEMPGRFERAMRLVSRRRTGKLLWPLAVALARISRLPAISRAGMHLQGLAETAALYAGVFEADGDATDI